MWSKYFYLYFIYSVGIKFYRGDDNRYGKILWGKKETDQEAIDISANTALSDKTKKITEECAKMEKKQKALMTEQRNKYSGDFIHLKKTKLVESGIDIINSADGKILNKEITDLYEAKKLVNTLPYGDGILKRKGSDAYSIFKLKADIKSVRRPDADSEVYMKQSSKYANIMNQNIRNSLKKDLRQQNSKCPNTHPYPYKLGNLCCNNKVKTYDCDNCPSNNYIKCSHPPCGPSQALQLKNDIDDKINSTTDRLENGMKHVGIAANKGYRTIAKLKIL